MCQRKSHVTYTGNGNQLTSMLKAVKHFMVYRQMITKLNTKADWEIKHWCSAHKHSIHIFSNNCFFNKLSAASTWLAVDQISIKGPCIYKYALQLQRASLHWPQWEGMLRRVWKREHINKKKPPEVSPQPRAEMGGLQHPASAGHLIQA